MSQVELESVRECKPLEGLKRSTELTRVQKNTTNGGVMTAYLVPVVVTGQHPRPGAHRPRRVFPRDVLGPQPHAPHPL